MAWVLVIISGGRCLEEYLRGLQLRLDGLGDVRRPFQSVTLLRVGSPAFGKGHRAMMMLARYVSNK